MAIAKPTTPFTWEHDPAINYNGCGLTGYTGLDYHTIAQLEIRPAVRAQLGRRGYYKAGLALLPNGDLIASPIDLLAPLVDVPGPAGRGDYYARSWPIRLQKSTDRGHSWHPIEHTPLMGKESSLTCLPNGNILFTSEPLDGVAVSEDGGQTWRITTFQTPRGELGLVQIIRSPIRQHDGTISLLRCVGIHEGALLGDARQTLARCRAWLHHSADGGRSWSDREEVATWDDPFPLFAEADFLTLPDGRILVTSRFEYLHPIAGTSPPHPPGTMPNDHAGGHMVLMESTDGGRHWSRPRDFTRYSEVHGQLTLLRDGRLLCTHNLYRLPFGIGAVVSEDLGETWDFDHPYQLAISNGCSTGWPTTRQLPDGTLVTVYALMPYHLEPEASGQHVCHSVHWELPAASGRHGR